MPKSQSKTEAVKKTQEDQDAISLLDNLHPSKINWGNISDDNQKKIAQEAIDKWIDTLHKDVSELLGKHGITKYQLSFLHEGSRSPMLIVRGNTYDAAKLAVVAARSLRDRVTDELAV